MKKIPGLFVMAALLSFTSPECGYYFDLKVGDQIEMQSFDEKNKLTGTSKQMVIARDGNRISFKSTSYTPKNKENGSVTYDVKCDGGNVHVDMKSFLNPEVYSTYDPTTIKVTGNSLQLPTSLSVGQTLPDGEVSVRTAGDVDMLMMDVKLNNRKVDAKEDITTPAGTFNCYKISYDIVSKVAFIKTSGKGAEWYSPEKGLIRSESYDKNGKLNGYTVRTR